MKTRNYLIGGTLLAAGTLMAINAMKTTPKGVTPVKPFDIKKYLGKWYEVARMRVLFERHMNHTTAEYSMNEDGSIKVVNRGYDVKKQKWNEITGRAVFAGAEDEACLKVSFFGPMYSGYNVIKLDPEYKYALVAGKNRHYLWLLSREKDVPPHIRKEYLKTALDLGFNISHMVWPEQFEPGEKEPLCDMLEVDLIMELPN